jgi:protein phosphatase
MGGQVGGNVASELAVATVFDYVRKHRSSSEPHCRSEERLRLLTQAIEAGCEAIIKRVGELPDLDGMGTTIVAVSLCAGLKPAAAVTHVGDSRAYLIRGDQIRALTTDHSLVEQLVTEGQITRQEARTHPRQNVLLKALGVRYESLPDAQVVPLEPHDRLLLCTDGLTKMLSEADILAIILTPELSDGERCEKLIEHANSCGGPDNTTVVIISPDHSPA